MTLKDRRLAAGLTLQQLADKSGMHYVNIAKIEAGRIDIRNITLRNALRLAHALNCRPEDLIPLEP